jgi:hypothetical protein
MRDGRRAAGLTHLLLIWTVVDIDVGDGLQAVGYMDLKNAVAAPRRAGRTPSRYLPIKCARSFSFSLQ